jgi:hypothetical protein
MRAPRSPIHRSQLASKLKRQVANARQPDVARRSSLANGLSAAYSRRVTEADPKDLAVPIVEVLARLPAARRRRCDC